MWCIDHNASIVDDDINSLEQPEYGVKSFRNVVFLAHVAFDEHRLIAVDFV